MLGTQRKPDIIFPSFASMSHQLQKDTLRLPCYRESVFFRFHPYPQTRRRPVDHLMVSNFVEVVCGRSVDAIPVKQTVDYRSVEQPVVNAVVGAPLVSVRLARCFASTFTSRLLQPLQTEGDLSKDDAVNLDLAVNTAERPHVKKRRSLTSLIVVRRACFPGFFSAC